MSSPSSSPFNDLASEFSQLSTSIGRRKWLSRHVAARSNEYTRPQTLSVFGGTWNVNGRLPLTSMDMHEWLLTSNGSGADHDMYMIGLQEVQPLAGVTSLTTDVTAGRKWASHISSILNGKADGYVLVANKQMVGILLLVFLKREHADYLDGVYYSYAGTGFMKAGGNKGGVAAYLMLYDKTISCVSCHLAAHDSNADRRNQDFHDVVRKAVFSPSNPSAASVPPARGFTSSAMFNNFVAVVADSYAGGNATAMAAADAIGILDSDAVFWLGDLNYRINLPASQVLSMVESSRWDELAKHDQLKISMNQKASFDGFQEAAIHFAPTYKLNRDNDKYERNEEGDLKKIPSYTDRILWRVKDEAMHQDFIRLKSYSRCLVYGSDHRPVRALFKVEVGSVDRARKDDVRKQVQEEMDQTFNRLRPSIDVSDHNPQLGRVVFGVPSYVTIELHSKSQTPASVTIPTSEFPDWLSLDPPINKPLYISNDSDKKLRFCVHVTSKSKSSIKLGCGAEPLSATVRLVVGKGGELFVTLEGSYRHTAWGTSLDTLVQYREPMRFAKKHDFDEATEPLLPIPKEIWHLVDTLMISKAHLTKGLFVEKGDSSKLDKVRQRVDTGTELDESVDPLLIGCCLLDLLESFQTPVVPMEWYDAVVSAGRNRLESEALVQALPAVTANVVRYVGSYLDYIEASREVMEEFAKVLVRVPEGKRKKQDLTERTRFLEGVVKSASNGSHKAIFDLMDPRRNDTKSHSTPGADDRERRRKNRSYSTVNL
eukprot:Plantae.Rhodophyta-Hildenbrandia_rubra.ctg6140.p1 GENE.Plantae.Rhodophyta-Hildenbrandia_rubra.ctg6140~~Plantae.Rhodophyta-Hildenbrandia_rubra.ctg6140.p1  ORF type:complete len:769 (-),score=131.09 Plantae.Rhodophyta-Hildenbrandia_rubra.ctg6140:3974-6280(-)